MTQPLTDLDVIEQRLRGALLDAIVADGLKPPAERVGLVAAMLAVVRPELARLTAELEQAQAERDAWRGKALAVAAKGCPVQGSCDWWPAESLDEHLARAHSTAELVETVCDLNATRDAAEYQPREQVLTEAAAKLREMARTAPRSRRAGCLSFASGVLDGMADSANAVRPAIDRALERDHTFCGVEPCSDCR